MNAATTVGWSDRLRWAASVIGARLPAPVRAMLRRIGFTGRARLCPVCGRTARRFLPAGVVVRADAVCPWCGSRERQRLGWLYLRRCTSLFDGPGRLLHLAPERSLRDAFARARTVENIGVDLNPIGVDVASDLTALAFRDRAFDAILCSHVLEHVVDDAAAMAELHRVLRTGGFALVQVPLRQGTTYEDFSITTPEGRLAAFEQSDHVRIYGLDIVSRLERAGFRVTTARASDLVPEPETRRMALDRDEVLFRCDRDD